MNTNFFKILLFSPAAISIPVYAVDYLTEAAAQKTLFPQANNFLKKDVLLTQVMIDKIKDQSNVKPRNKKPSIWQVKNKNKDLGYFFVDEVVGKHEFITYALATDMQGQVINIEIMSYRETHGGQIRERNWLKNFVGKKMSDAFKLDVDIPNITGATLSCRNVLDGVKRLLVTQKILKEENVL